MPQEVATTLIFHEVKLLVTDHSIHVRSNALLEVPESSSYIFFFLYFPLFSLYLTFQKAFHTFIFLMCF